MTDDDKECQESSDSIRIQHSGAAVSMETTETDSLTGSQTAVTKEKICEFLSCNPKIYFKSQQIDDPDLTAGEKKLIALELYDLSKRNFLLRFGKYLQKEHLQFFAANMIANDDEMNLLLKNLIEAIENHDHDVKNRRYVAMQTMIKAGIYFSECEMMRREPHLYEQMVGQYLTDSEKRIRDRTDEECCQFSDVLLENYDKDEMEKLRKKQEQDEGEDSDDDTIMSGKTDQSVSYNSENDGLFPQIPASQRKQWGEFEDDVPPRDVQCAKPYKPKTPKRDERLITASEREMLRQEFVGMMYEKFLEGQDKEFDYDAIDNNADLDDLQQINQDREDKYFEDDDSGGSDGDTVSEPAIGENEETDSEDELDVYMKHLNKHPSLTTQHDKC